MAVYKKLDEMGLSLPEHPPQGGLYKSIVQQGNLLYLAGIGPVDGDGVPQYTGKLDSECSLEDGRAAAKRIALNALAVLDNHLGDLNKISRLIKTLGFVASSFDFNDQPKVVDGCSQVFEELFGEAGVGARSAIGVYELPDDYPVEIEFIFEIKDE